MIGVKDILGYKRRAWDRQVERGSPYTIPVGPEVVARALKAHESLVLTPTKPTPADWFPPLAGLDVLCLASGGVTALPRHRPPRAGRCGMLPGLPAVVGESSRGPVTDRA
jgi:hypothetical protein